MTEELHLRISGKGCRDGLGEASWEGLSVPMSPRARVPVCLCPHVPVSPRPRCWRGDEGKGFCSTTFPLELPLVALKSLEKRPDLLLPLP